MIVRDGLTIWNERTPRTTVTRITLKLAAREGLAGLTRISAPPRARRCMNVVLSVIGRWTDACLKMNHNTYGDQIFWRDCFACGKPMTVIKDGMVTLECKDCDVQENGTIQGRFTYTPAAAVEWSGMWIKTVDHSKEYLPSPDVIGNEPLPLPQPALQQKTMG